MIKCSSKCVPCCDFCIHAIHEEIKVPDRIDPIMGGPTECKLHKDDEHKEIAEGCGYCDDFQCFRANKENGLWYVIHSN